jgi:hypothetical protein
VNFANSIRSFSPAWTNNYLETLSASLGREQWLRLGVHLRVEGMTSFVSLSRVWGKFFRSRSSVLSSSCWDEQLLFRDFHLQLYEQEKFFRLPSCLSEGKAKTLESLLRLQVSSSFSRVCSVEYEFSVSEDSKAAPEPLLSSSCSSSQNILPTQAIVYV